MTFAIANFSPLGANSRRGKAPAHYTYRTTDTLLACGTSAYFNTVSSMLQVGDVIEVEVVDSVTTPTVVSDYGRLIVQSNASGVVDTYEDQTGWVALNVDMTDVSTAATVWTVAPISGTIKKIYSIINGAISGADSVLTASIGTTAITNGVITIGYSGSAAGDIDSCTPTAENVVTAGQYIKVVGGGQSTDTARATITILIKPSLVDAA